MPQQSDDRVDRASAFGSIDLEFDSESRQTNDLKNWYSQFPCLMLSIKETVWSKSESLLVVPL